MDFTIEEFSQEAVMALQRERVIVSEDGTEQREIVKLDLTDLFLLNFLLCQAPIGCSETEVINGETYYRFYPKRIIETLPLLNMKKHHLGERLDKYVFLDVLSCIRKDLGNDTSVMLYTWGKNYESLFAD